MIVIKIDRSPSGSIYSLRVSGHAGAGKKGEDLVCCAVSAVVQTALLGIKEVVGIKNEFVYQKGLIHWTLPEGIPEVQAENSQLILETMLVGLRSIQLGHERYLDIQDNIYYA